MLNIHFHQFRKISFFLVLILSSLTHQACSNEARIIAPPSNVQLKLPPGFEVSVFSKLAENYGQPRMLAFDKQGHLFVTLASSNSLVMLPDTNKDGLAEAAVLISDKLNAPNGVAFVGDDLLVANQDAIVKLTKNKNQWSAPAPFIGGFASGGHTLKTIKISPDNFLYINVGSSCNVCLEDDPTRATILRYTLDGKPAGALEIVGRHSLAPIWARGLRNSQSFTWHPTTGAMFATNNGADNRSGIKNGKVNDDIPPEHLNKIEPSKHYGWPYCWGDGKNSLIDDPNFLAPNVDFCKTATAPAITFDAHSTPIGMTFLDKSNFPAEYKSDAIVALHGSWNRKNPNGYKLVRVKFNGDKPVEVVDFATGWLNENAAWGRPVDVMIGPDGALYVSDDRAGTIYRISYRQTKH